MSESFKQISDRLLTSSNYEQVDEVEWDIQKLVKIHNKTEEENQELKKDKSKLQNSLIKIMDEINNGEHIDKEWIESILREQVQHPLIDASVKMYESYKKQNQELKRKLAKAEQQRDLAVEAIRTQSTYINLHTIPKQTTKHKLELNSNLEKLLKEIKGQ